MSLSATHIQDPRGFIQHEIDIIVQDQENHRLFSQALKNLSEEITKYVALILNDHIDAGIPISFESFQTIFLD